MTDQPPPPSDKKPRRRSAPRKHAATKRAPKAKPATAETSDLRADAVDATSASDATSAPAEVAAKLDPHPLVDVGDRGDAPASDSPLAATSDGDAGRDAPAVIATPTTPDAATRAPGTTVSRDAEALQADAAQSAGGAPAGASSPQLAAAAPFPRQAELRPGELIRVPLSVRWRDLDAFNHVNNSKYLSYLEEARLRWMLAMPGMGMDENVAPVVAASNLNYRRPIEWPGDVVIELFVERIGGSSLTIGHRIVDSKDGRTLYCDGNVVMVWIDRNSGRSAPLPESVRAACR